MNKIRENNVEKLIRKDYDIKGYVLREFAESLIQAVEEQIKKDGNKEILEIVS